MKKKDEDAFLKSIFGASPIKKKDRLEKKIPTIKNEIFKKKLIEKTKINIQENEIKKEISKSFFTLEKGPINKKLKKGKIPIDRKIDFHGLSVLDAEELFLKTIVNCYNQNLRCILFVTGKGVMKKNKTDNDNIKLYYGKIRQNFIIWISKNEVQQYILSVEQAGIEHGADGAFFVYLRKKS